MLMIGDHIMQDRKMTRMHAPSPSTVTRLRVAAYARVSRDEEDNLHSLAAQIAHYTSLIGGNPAWECAGVFHDDGITGTKRDVRPGFKALIARCDEGLVDVVLVKSISRFARNTLDLLETVRHLRAIGVSVRFEREHIDTMTGDGELMLTLLAAFAEAEARSASENVKWAVRKRFEAGLPQHVQLYGYRWRVDHYEIEPHEAEVVRRVFHEYLEGASPLQIARALNAEGERTGSGREFTDASIAGLLRHEEYMGRTTLQKWFKADVLDRGWKANSGQLPQYEVEGLHPRLIDDGTFGRAQEEIAHRRSPHILASRTQQFSCFTRKVWCADCGHVYRRRNARSKDHPPYHYWKCLSRIDGGAHACTGRNVSEELLKQASCRVLGLETFDGQAFSTHVMRIDVSQSTLVFHMDDRRIVETEAAYDRESPAKPEGRES